MSELHMHFHFHFPPFPPAPVGGGSGKDAAAEAPGGHEHFEGQAAEQAAASGQAGNEPGSSAPPSATPSESAPATDGPAGAAEAEAPAPGAASASTFGVCERCGGEFSTTSPARRYCSGKCSKAAQNQRWRERQQPTARAVRPEPDLATASVEPQAATSLVAMRRQEAQQSQSIREKTKREQVQRMHRAGVDFETISQRLGLGVEDVRRIVLATEAAHAQRNAIPGVSVTAELMGDPAPGRSALDQRRGGAA